MYLSETERNRRSKSLCERMRREDIDTILVIGDSAQVSARGTGSFRYLTDFFVYASYSFLLFFADSERVMLVPTENSRYWASKRSWIDDVRLSTHYPSDIVKVLNEKAKTNHGKLGLVSMESLPPSLFDYLRENLTTMQLIDADPILFDLRFAKSEEEQLLLKRAAEIIDAGFHAVQKMIKPGVKEYEIVGFLEGFHLGHGSEKTFNLISSGPFPPNKDQDFPTLPSSPSDRKIKKGDVICLEMTTAYKGYWNQLVREISVGMENRDLSAFHGALAKTIRAGVGSMKPGYKTKDFVTSMEKAAKKEGFKFAPPMGHFVGLDLTEASISPENQLVLRSGTSAILHPCLVDDKGTRVFWGETYLVGDNETTCLNQSNNELVVV